MGEMVVIAAAVLVRYLVLPGHPQTRGCRLRMLAILKMKATKRTEIAAISTHMMD